MVHINDTVIRGAMWVKDAVGAVGDGRVHLFAEEMRNNREEMAAAVECGAPYELIGKLHIEYMYLTTWANAARRTVRERIETGDQTVRVGFDPPANRYAAFRTTK